MPPSLRQSIRPALTCHKGIAGIDEAGRGPLAGPLAVAAVLLDPEHPIAGLNDSKMLSHRQREQLFEIITGQALAIALVFVPCAEIDQLNIRGATLTGMRQAASALYPLPDAFLIDGRDVPEGLPRPAQALIGGDGLNAAIAAASIIAKVARDRAMRTLALDYPGYGFEQHMGYGTKKHRQALMRLGPTPIHRLSFAPVAAAQALHGAARPNH